MKNLDWKVKESVRVIKEANKKWYPNIGIAFTGKKDSTVLAYLICNHVNKIPKALFIDHGEHFPETVSNVEKVSKMWGLDLTVLKDDGYSKNLSKNQLRKQIYKYKIDAIEKALELNEWNALYTAIRWDEQVARSSESYFSKRETHYRVHPLLHFTEEDIWQYIRMNNLPYNPLYDLGYRSIGEKGFTKRAKYMQDNERSGRDKSKEEVMDRLRSLGYF